MAKTVSPSRKNGLICRALMNCSKNGLSEAQNAALNYIYIYIKIYRYIHIILKPKYIYIYSDCIMAKSRQLSWEPSAEKKTR